VHKATIENCGMSCDGGHGDKESLHCRYVYTQPYHLRLYHAFRSPRALTCLYSSSHPCEHIAGAGPSDLVAAKTLLNDAPLDTFRVRIFDT
jgi:hypothetical protein